MAAESRHGEAVIIRGGYESAVSPQSESEACGAEVIDNPSLVGMHHPQFFTYAHLRDSAEASAFQEAQAFMKIKHKGWRGSEADVEWFLMVALPRNPGVQVQGGCWGGR